jgi:phosphoglycerate dehydrogenase-like enzyme
MKRRLVILPPRSDITDQWATVIAAEATELEVAVAGTREEALALLPGAQAAYGTLDRELLAAAPHLQWLQAPQAAPPAGFYFPELVDHPVVVTNFRGIFNDHVATHAVALLLALARGLPLYFRQQMRAEWTRHVADADILHLPEATVLIIGVGGIGASIGHMLRAFGARILGLDPRRKDVPDGFERIYHPSDLDELLPRADAVVLTLPHTPESEGLIDARRLALMPPHGLLVNIGRGATVRLDAVCEALREGRLGGVGLDVFEEEPLPAEHPLWREPRALLTPHVAVVGPYIDDRRFQVFRYNAQRFMKGQRLKNVVEKSLWY